MPVIWVLLLRMLWPFNLAQKDFVGVSAASSFIILLFVVDSASAVSAHFIAQKIHIRIRCW